MSPGSHDYAHGGDADVRLVLDAFRAFASRRHRNRDGKHASDVEWIEPADIFTVRNGLIVHM